MEKDILTFIEVDKNILSNLKNVARLECSIDDSHYTLNVKAFVEVVDTCKEYNLAHYFFFFPHNPLRALVEENRSAQIKQFCSKFLERIVTFKKRFVSQDDIDELFLELLEELSQREFYTQVYKRV